jgi:hypothetical protein
MTRTGGGRTDPLGPAAAGAASTAVVRVPFSSKE